MTTSAPTTTTSSAAIINNSSSGLLHRSVPPRPLSYTFSDVLQSSVGAGQSRDSRRGGVAASSSSSSARRARTLRGSSLPEEYAERFKSRPTTRPAVVDFSEADIRMYSAAGAGVGFLGHAPKRLTVPGAYSSGSPAVSRYFDGVQSSGQQGAVTSHLTPQQSRTIDTRGTIAATESPNIHLAPLQYSTVRLARDPPDPSGAAVPQQARASRPPLVPLSSDQHLPLPGHRKFSSSKPADPSGTRQPPVADSRSSTRAESRPAKAKLVKPGFGNYIDGTAVETHRSRPAGWGHSSAANGTAADIEGRHQFSALDTLGPAYSYYASERGGGYAQTRGPGGETSGESLPSPSTAAGADAGLWGRDHYDDLSNLPRPKKILPRRDLPWVFRFKVKKEMNALSKIMASKPPQGAIPALESAAADSAAL